MAYDHQDIDRQYQPTVTEGADLAIALGGVEIHQLDDAQVVVGTDDGEVLPRPRPPRTRSAWISAWITDILAKNPAVGGTPAMENIRHQEEECQPGIASAQALEILQPIGFEVCSREIQD